METAFYLHTIFVMLVCVASGSVSLSAYREAMKRESVRARSQHRADEAEALRAAEAEAQAEASRALIAICSMPYTEAVPVPPETDTAIYCAARQQPISIPK